jgi:hypothetical protein
MSRPKLAVCTFVLAALGCASGVVGSDDFRVSAKDDGMSDVGERLPTGTFRSDEAQPGELALLVLKADGSYYLETGEGRESEGACTFVPSGTLWIVALDDGEWFDCSLDGDTLKLQVSGASRWQTMHRADEAWCAVPADCEVQDLAPARCFGEWDCIEGRCAFPCQNRSVCEIGGGSCMQLGEGARCPAGSTAGDASLYSCGEDAAAGTACCVPLRPLGPTMCHEVGGMCVTLTADPACPNGLMIADSTQFNCGEAVQGMICCVP